MSLHAIALYLTSLLAAGAPTTGVTPDGAACISTPWPAGGEVVVAHYAAGTHEEDQLPDLGLLISFDPRRTAQYVAWLSPTGTCQ